MSPCRAGLSYRAPCVRACVCTRSAQRMRMRGEGWAGPAASARRMSASCRRWRVLRLFCLLMTWWRPARRRTFWSLARRLCGTTARAMPKSKRNQVGTYQVGPHCSRLPTSPPLAHDTTRRRRPALRRDGGPAAPWGVRSSLACDRPLRAIRVRPVTALVPPTAGAERQRGGWPMREGPRAAAAVACARRLFGR